MLYPLATSPSIVKSPPLSRHLILINISRDLFANYHPSWTANSRLFSSFPQVRRITSFFTSTSWQVSSDSPCSGSSCSGGWCNCRCRCAWTSKYSLSQNQLVKLTILCRKPKFLRLGAAANSAGSGRQPHLISDIPQAWFPSSTSTPVIYPPCRLHPHSAQPTSNTIFSLISYQSFCCTLDLSSHCSHSTSFDFYISVYLRLICVDDQIWFISRTKLKSLGWQHDNIFNEQQSQKIPLNSSLLVWLRSFNNGGDRILPEPFFFALWVMDVEPCLCNVWSCTGRGLSWTLSGILWVLFTNTMISSYSFLLHDDFQPKLRKCRPKRSSGCLCRIRFSDIS